MVDKGAKPDQLIARLAGRQHGVVTTSQLNAIGLSRAAVAKRIDAGRLHRLHRGVHAVGHRRITFEGRCLAAALALGDDAVVSHASAAAIWGMLTPPEGPVHVTVARSSGRKNRKGITTHRSRTLTAAVRARRRNIPITTAARTLRDLHRTVPEFVYRRALRRGLDLRLIGSVQIPEEALTRSELERMFLALCRRRRVPRPEVNARVGPYEVDFLWREPRVIVETDGYAHHANRAVFEGDRARDARLQSRGFRVLRFTYRQISDEPEGVAAALRALLRPWT